MQKKTYQISKKDQEGIKNAVSDTLKNSVDSITPQISIFVKKAQKTGINENFIMVIQETEAIICQLLTNAEFKVFGFIRSYSKYDNEINADIKLIADSCLMTDRTVKKALKKLALLNIIKIQSNLVDKRRNYYVLNPQSSWKGMEAKRQEIIKNVFNAEPGLRENQLKKDLTKRLKSLQLQLQLQPNTD